MYAIMKSTHTYNEKGDLRNRKYTMTEDTYVTYAEAINAAYDLGNLQEKHDPKLIIFYTPVDIVD